MNLSRTTIEGIAELICGSSGNSFRWRNFPYRTRKQIEEFFDDCGLPAPAADRERKRSVQRALEGLNRAGQSSDHLPSEAIGRLVQRLLEPDQFSGRADARDAALADVNSALGNDGLEVYCDAARGCGLRRVDRAAGQEAEQELDAECVAGDPRLMASLLTSSLSAIGVGDHLGRLIYANDALLEMWGYEDREDVIGRSIGEFWVDADFERTHRRLLIHEHIQIEAPAVREDGTVFAARMAARLVRDDSGEPLYLVGSFLDVTEQREAFQALQKSKEQYEDLVEQARIAIMIDDEKGSIRYFNREFTHLFGYSADELRDQSIQILIHPDDVGRVIGIHRDRVAGKPAPERYEVHGLKKDGSAIHLEVSAVELVEDGERVGTRSYFWDVTDRKKIEEALLRNEATFDGLFRAAPIGIGLVDNRVFRFVNDLVCEMTGYPREELLGQSVRILYESDQEFERAGDVMYADVARSGTGTIETRLRRKDGSSFDCLIKSSAIDPNDFSSSVISTVMDMTERRRADALQQALYEILHAATEAADLPALISEIRRLLGTLIDTTNFYVALYDPVTDRYRFPFFADEYDTADPDATEALPESLTDYVRRTGQPQLIDAEVTAILEESGEVGLVGTDSALWMGAPLRSERGIIGVVAVQSYDDPQLYSDSDLALLDYAAGTISIAVERKRAEEELRTRAEFERVITEVSAAFINLAAEVVDKGIADALRTIGEFAGVDRSYVFQFAADGDTANNTHEWCAEGVSPQIERLQNIKLSDFPLLLPALARGEVFHVPRVADLPPEAAAEREEFEAEGIQSIIVVPMLGRGRVVGALGFDSVRRETRWSEDTIALLQVAGDALANALERQRAERALRESEERYRLLFERNLAGVYRSTLDGRLLECNEAFARIFGFTSPEETQSRPPAEFYQSTSDRSDFVSELVEHGWVINREEIRRKRDGEQIRLIVNAGLVPDPAGDDDVIEGTVYDITEQRNVEHQLRQAQKMEAVGQLAGGIAHDFNNLLMAITSYTDLLKVKLGQEHELSWYVSNIREATDRAAVLVSQILAFGRKQMLQPRVLDLNTVVKGLEGMLRRTLPETIAVEQSLDPELNQIEADSSQIEQIVLNLAINSRDAMPEGGALSITTRNSEFHNGLAADFPGLVSGRYAELVIVDTGTGMDNETLSQIFEPFFTTKGVGQGSGLGLAQVWGIVKQSGGFIYADSEVGVGTSFRILLPAVDSDLEPAVEKREETSVAGGTETVLVTEDDDKVRAGILEALRSLGYSVLEARDGDHALVVARQHEGPIQALVTDMVMPGIPVEELIDRLSGIYPDIRVLHMTGYRDAMPDPAGVVGSRTAFLLKPFSINDLASNLRLLLDPADERS